MNCRKLLAGPIIAALLLALPTSARAAVLDTWEWRHPLPHGNALKALTSGQVAGAETLVAVGQGGTITTSGDGTFWVLQHSGTGNTLNDVVHANGVFTAVGDSGTILSSTGAVIWNPRVSGTSSQLTSLAQGNGRSVAVGTFTNLVSTDGIIWSPGSLGTNLAYLNKVAFGSNVFVAVGYRSAFGPKTPVILSSTDGLTWSRAALPIPVPADAELRGVVFDQEQFVVVGGEVPPVIYTSPDGLAWTQRPHFAGALYSVASGNGRYAAVGLSGGTGFSAISTNGVDWTNRYNSLALGRDLRVAFGGGSFLAFGAGGIMQASTNGLNYAPPPTAYRGEFWDVLWTNGLYVAVGDIDGFQGLDASILTSTDGATWSAAPGFTRNPWRSLAFGNGKYVVVGLFSSVLTSADGITWDHPGQPTGAGLWGLTFGNGMFVGVGENGAIVTSPDGVTWTPRTSGVTEVLYGVTYGNGIFVAVGGPEFSFNSGVTLTSPDGINWSPVTWTGNDNPAPTAPLRGVSYFSATPGQSSGGHFVAVGFNGQVRKSLDGLIWVKRSAGASAPLKKVILVGETYVVVGHAGLIMTSPDLQNWLPVPSGTFNDLNGIASNGASTVVAGLYGTILQTAGSGGLSITDFSFTGGVFQLRALTQTGDDYKLEWTSDFSNWLEVDSVTGNGQEQTLSDNNTGGFDYRFYRISVE